SAPATGSGTSDATCSRLPFQSSARTRARYTARARVSCRVGKGAPVGLARGMMQFELTPEQKQLKETARRFAADEIIPVAGKYDEEQTFAEDVVRKAWELGLMNFAVPEELGGPGLGALDTCLVLEELNYGCAGITNSVAA